MTIPIIDRFQHWDSTFRLAENELCITLLIDSLTPSGQQVDLLGRRRQRISVNHSLLYCTADCTTGE